MEKLRLSPSRVNDFTNCPQLYKYRSILNLPEEISLDAERGKLVHSVLEDLFEIPRLERDQAQATSLLPSAWQRQIAEKPELEQLVTNQQEWMDRAKSLLQTYFSLEDPTTFDATYRELHLEKDFSDQIYLHGYVDRLDIAPTGQHCPHCAISSRSSASTSRNEVSHAGLESLSRDRPWEGQNALP